MAYILEMYTTVQSDFSFFFNLSPSSVHHREAILGLIYGKRDLGEGNGNPLQYSCLENTMDGGAWWAAVYRVAQSQTRLKRLSSSSSKTVPDGPVVKNVHASARDARDTVSIPGLERSPGVGNGNPLQYSCLENSMDRKAWWATVCGSQGFRHD